MVHHSDDSTGQCGSLFIEDALANLDREQVYDQEDDPFESFQAIVDILFLRGSFDLVVAKQAILLQIYVWMELLFPVMLSLLCC